MGKMIGAFLGFFFFGPVGALLGFLIGALFDSRVRISTNGFFFTDFGAGNTFRDSFPLLAAAVTRAGGLTKPAVLTVKNIATQLFGIQNAVFMMQKYRNYVENGFNNYILNETCENILYTLDHQSKIYIISLLFTILKSRNTFSPEEIFVIQNISRNIGVSGYEFESILNRYKSGDFRSNNYSQSRVYKSNPYQVLQVDKSASIEDIKKQFRKLSKKYHPDMTLNLPESEKKEAEVKMKEIINAYDIIKKERGFK